MERPRIKIKLSTIDYIVEIFGLLVLICIIIMPIYYFNDLPERLPSHFNAFGQPDSYSGRGMIW